VDRILSVRTARSELGRKRTYEDDTAFYVIAGFTHSVVAIKIAAEVKMNN
jgi:hypothetical protein